jgi:predicted metalloprotease with PDZ domain
MMPKKLLSLIVIALFFAGASLSAQKTADYRELQVSTNLNQLENGKLRVVIKSPTKNQDTLIYAMPKIVPGTYSIANYGLMISEMEARDQKNNLMAVVSLDENRWMITGAKNLASITYLAAPTFTDPAGRHIFEPAGTRFAEGKNFVLNNFGIVGYFEGFDDYTYQFEVTKPKDFYGATALSTKSLNDSTDLFTAKGYFDFHDSPVMYSLPDTAGFKVGNTQIEISVYSPNKSLDAAFVKEQVQDIMIGAAAYLGGELPVDKYVILITLLEGMSNSGGFGALEHSYSTVFVLPEMSRDFLAQTIRDVTAHEFFHIVTPLNIHSEHIHNYNFNEPQMSQHLWFYEGSTEYAAHHMQVQQGLISPEDFLEVIKQKILQASSFDDKLPFTELSKGALDEHAGQYQNVYLKGALISMCLDLLLCDLSDGKYNLPMLTADLSKKFGMEKPFDDELFFDEITALSYPAVAKFFDQYVDGPQPLPMAEYLAKAGVLMLQNQKVKEITLGGFLTGFNQDLNLMDVATSIGINSFGRELGLKKGDALVSVNGIDLSPEKYREGLKTFQNNTAAGDKVKLEVMRIDKKGKWKKTTLTGTATEVEHTIQLHLGLMQNPTERQLRVRKAWLNQ